jgi:integrase/recombinase XerD
MRETMIDDRHDTTLLLIDRQVTLRNKTFNVPAIRSGQDTQADYVSHLTPGDVRLMVIVAERDPRHGKRNAALITLLFDGALRVSEALGVRPIDIIQDNTGYAVRIMGKGSRPGVAAITPETANVLLSYCYDKGILKESRIFPITRSQVFRIVEAAYKAAGVRQPSKITDRVGAVHVLRHSGALARLAASGNPKSVQEQLRHKSAQMTLRYMKTLSSDESLKIQQGVNPW